MTQPADDTPVACTLGSAGLARQAELWNTLCARAGIERTETGDGLCLRFRRDPNVESELRQLVAVEVECCAWASWAISTDQQALVLEIRSAGDAVPVIHGWFVAP